MLIIIRQCGVAADLQFVKPAISGKYNKVKCHRKRYALFQCFLSHIRGIPIYTSVWLIKPEVSRAACSHSSLYPIHYGAQLIVFPKHHEVSTVFPVLSKLLVSLVWISYYCRYYSNESTLTTSLSLAKRLTSEGLPHLQLAYPFRGRISSSGLL